MVLGKEEIKIIPIWVQLWGLELKYWGEKALSKIISIMEDFIKEDTTTTIREKLQFVRALIEVGINKKFLDKIRFLNEKGVCNVR